jgi:hypothetical protein
MRSIDPHTPSFGSSHDPVLHGVASGLADLFPPVEQSTRTVEERQDEGALMPEVASSEEA